MINNFDQIATLLKFENEDEFYFIQILQRKKEHPDLGNNSRLIKTYYQYSTDRFYRDKGEIIKLCEVFNARAYIHLNRRNARKLALEYMEDLAHNIKSDHIKTLYNGYDSVCGKHQHEKDKTWIVDIDTKDMSATRGIAESIQNIRAHCFQAPYNRSELIETKNGYHLITAPFNSQMFATFHPEIEVHKNNPTLLFCP